MLVDPLQQMIGELVLGHVPDSFWDISGRNETCPLDKIWTEDQLFTGVRDAASHACGSRGYLEPFTLWPPRRNGFQDFAPSLWRW